MIEIFHFCDGKQKQIPIYSSTTSEEALEFLLQMVGLKNPVGYMVYESFSIVDKTSNSNEIQTIERSLLESEVICTSLSKFHQFKLFFEGKSHLEVETCFFVKRKLFLDQDISDPVEQSLMFHQVS